MVVNLKSEKRRQRIGYPDPTKTTCRDNPKGGSSPALLRASSICEAQERKLRKVWADAELQKSPNDRAEEIQKNIAFVRGR